MRLADQLVHDLDYIQHLLPSLFLKSLLFLDLYIAENESTSMYGQIRKIAMFQ